jgi:inner membrane protein
MDNVCHTLVGAAVARAGLDRKTAMALPTAIIAANLPDLDVLVFLTDIPPVAFRRGITHGLPAQVLLPIACAGAMWALGRQRTRVNRAGGPPRALPHFGWLLGLSYIGVLTHVFLDFLNSYGIRLLSPLSQRWFYGDAVFIVDVWLWLVLGAALVIGRALRSKNALRTAPLDAARRARQVVLAGLILAAAYVAAMLGSGRLAHQIVREAWIARTGTAPLALMVGPVPVTPFRRTVIVDAGDRYFEGTFRWFPAQVAFVDTSTPKNDDVPQLAAARQDPAVRGILVWSRFPFWAAREVPGGTEVQLRDMRFRGLDRGGFAATTLVPR